MWSYETNGQLDSSPTVDVGRNVYVGSFDNMIYAFRPIGSLLWSYETGDEISSSASIGGDGRLYIGSWDSALYVFEEPPPTTMPTETPTPTSTPVVTNTPTRTPIAPNTPTPIPQAENILNGLTFSAGDQFTATFQLNESIERSFTAFAVVILPGGGRKF